MKEMLALPSAQELEALEKAYPTAAQVVLTAWEKERESLNEEREDTMKLVLAQENNLQKHRTRSLFLGATLAFGAMGLGAYGIANNANLFALAALITPIVGLAGVFLWGYQRKV